ncbi:hypothetical protein [Methylocystis heyeri]|uniref:Uncharacterized protein n=1 Tax=Methylocystis heyeri TaxID=391905 RepID=A0A6B8KIY3_9HYPH|nr:hypothetical protein [Methylocystis heyeri]QGM46490.1 hypothetical protein H2LOC_012730 [Methylocystis heyeri]
MVSTQKSCRYGAAFAKGFVKISAALAMVGISASAGMAAAVTLNSPYGLAVDQSSGALYITDPVAGQVALYNPDSKTLSPFVTGQPNVFSVAVNSDGFVYTGVVGSNPQIYVYNRNGQAVNGLAVPPGDQPITMAFDADNILYQSFGFADNNSQINMNSYINNISIDFRPITGFAPYSRLQTYTRLNPGSRYAIAYDDGQMFVIGAYTGGTLNIYDMQILAQGRAADINASLGLSLMISYRAWSNNHIIPGATGPAFAAAVDAHHNIYYTNPDNKTISVTGKLINTSTLPITLPSSPFGIAFDKARSLLYLAFPSEHLVRAYKVSYTTRNGAQTPALTPVAFP